VGAAATVVITAAAVSRCRTFTIRGVGVDSVEGQGGISPYARDRTCTAHARSGVSFVLSPFHGSWRAKEYLTTIPVHRRFPP
jgi:hypothetical protein